MAPPNSSFALDFLRRLLCAHSSTGIARRRGGADDGDAAAAAGLVRCPAREEEEGVEARSPCIVARLMGLDAMPAVPARDQQQPLRRSRSASSADGCSPPCCFGDDDAPRPRVIRTASASFREKPTYLRRENDEFLLLSFSPEEEDDDHDDGKTGSSLLASRSDGDNDEIAGRRGRRRGDGARKQRRRRLRPRRRYGVYEEEATPGRSATPAECNLQNSSPVSVLEARDGQESSSTTSSSIEEAEPCSPSSGEIQPAPRQQQQQQQQQGSRRKLLQPDLDELGDSMPPPASSTCRPSRCADREKGNRRVVNQDDGTITLPNVAAIWQPVRRLLEDDLSGSVKWEGMGDATNIAGGVESEILDQLICEATDELVQLM